MVAWRNFRALPRADRRIVLWAIGLNVSLNFVNRVAGAKRAYRLSERAGSWRGASERRQPAPIQEVSATNTEMSVAAHVAGLVNHVSSRFPAKSACLVRSMTLRALLIRQNIAGELVVGAKPSVGGPLAHAWIEVAGIPMNDAGDIAMEYSRFDLGADHWTGQSAGREAQRVAT